MREGTEILPYDAKNSDRRNFNKPTTRLRGIFADYLFAARDLYAGTAPSEKG